MRDIRTSMPIPPKVMDEICDLEDAYANECIEISEECMAEGYPPFDSHYELRCENARKWYDEQIDELLEDYITDMNEDVEDYDEWCIYELREYEW